MLEIFRLFYNPFDMEWGDKRLTGQPMPKGLAVKEVARTHWFRPNEVPQDASEVGLRVVQATTVASIRKNPKGNSTKLHKQGRLVYVLQRPV